MEGVEPHTVWTWNAIGKQAGAWGLAPDAPEAHAGFLLNHLIAEHLPTARRRGAAHELRSGHRPGGVVRPARRLVNARRARPASGRAFEPLPARGTPRFRADALRWTVTMKLGLVIDLDTCVGCHACATACKEWNGASAISGPLTD